jgi:hypothetical protein
MKQYAFRHSELLEVKSANRTGYGWVAEIIGYLNQSPVHRSRIKLYNEKERSKFAEELSDKVLENVPSTQDQRTAFTEKIKNKLIAISDKLDQMSRTQITPVQPVPELQDRTIHPGLHIERNFSSVGVNTINRYWIYTSSGRMYDADADNIKPSLTTLVHRHPKLVGRWNKSDDRLNLSDAVALLINKE